nr:MAG TPA: hypothetical protein [Caudoviricetes sp.]
MSTNLTMKMLQEQINELRNEVAILKGTSKSVKIPSGLKIGDTFELAGLNWKILNISDSGYMCVADKLDEEMVFDKESNDWIKSQLREYLNTNFIDRIADEIGEDNLIAFNRDLISLDGQIEYGDCEDKVSLLTVDEYRKYRSLIPNTDDYWWWLISPWSTHCNRYDIQVSVVAPSGFIRDCDCDCYRGVRPVCIFSSAIFESEE